MSMSMGINRNEYIAQYSSNTTYLEGLEPNKEGKDRGGGRGRNSCTLYDQAPRKRTIWKCILPTALL